MAAVVAVYATLGGSIPSWVVWTLVAIAFYFAGFCVWREERHKNKANNEEAVSQAVERYLDELDRLESSEGGGQAGDYRIGALQRSGFSSLNDEQAEKFFQTIISRGRPHPLTANDLAEFAVASDFPFKNMQEVLTAASAAGRDLSSSSGLLKFLLDYLSQPGRLLAPTPPSSDPDRSGTPPESTS